jgi:hypothetical protein
MAVGEMQLCKLAAWWSSKIRMICHHIGCELYASLDSIRLEISLLLDLPGRGKLVFVIFTAHSNSE